MALLLACEAKHQSQLDIPPAPRACTEPWRSIDPSRSGYKVHSWRGIEGRLQDRELNALRGRQDSKDSEQLFN
jgi:hypothetical protein